MRFTLLLLIIILSASSSYCQEFDVNRLVAFGSIEVSTPADNASFSFEIEGVGSSLNEAVNEAKSRVSLISGALFENGLDKNSLRTSYFHSGENYGDKSFLSSKRDYKARITVLVNIDSLDLLESSIIIVSEAEPEKISNIKFSLKDFEQIKIDALEKAVLKSKEKANILASKMGAKLGNILFIEEIRDKLHPFRSRRTYPNPFNAAYEIEQEMVNVGKSKSAGFFAQQIKIDSRVKIIVELITENGK